MRARWPAVSLLAFLLLGAIGLAWARPAVKLPVSLDDIEYRDGRACWPEPMAAGCNVHGCWDRGGGCNVHGCWSGPRGKCNVHGCSDVGVCNVHGCPSGGRVKKARQICVAEDELPAVLGYDPDDPGACNVHGCFDAGGGCNVHGCWSYRGGCNVHGCWNSPVGSCNEHGCSDVGVCNVHGCP